MLKTGKDHLEGLRDGRIVYVGNERIRDVTSHPAFRNAARTIAEFYDVKRDPANQDTTSWCEGGERFSAYFLKARSKGDLQKRTDCHRLLARTSYGLLGRSPDYIASFVTGMALKPELFGKYSDNVSAIYEHMKRTDLYAAHAIVSPQAARALCYATIATNLTKGPPGSIAVRMSCF